MPDAAADWRLDGIDPTGAFARSVGLARQAMAADLVTRGDGWERGVRSVLLQNDRISIEVVVDRSLDIASARIRQIPIAWRSPTEIVAPWFVENSGFGPHRGFFGGLLTTCGLDHIGAPAERSAERFGYRARATDAFPMHGRISGSPARLSAYGVREADGGLEAFVEGAVTQVAVFGEHLTLTRRVSIAYGSAVIRVDGRGRQSRLREQPARRDVPRQHRLARRGAGRPREDAAAPIARRGRKLAGARAFGRRAGAGLGVRRRPRRPGAGHGRDRQQPSRRCIRGRRQADLGCRRAAHAGAMGNGERRGTLCHRARALHGVHLSRDRRSPASRPWSPVSRSGSAS